MTPSKINQLLKSLKCPHYQDPRRSPYFPHLCESCARFARIHLESILQDWIYCNNEDSMCAASPHLHDNVIILNPTQFLRQVQNDYYGEFFVQIKSDRIYIIAKFSNNHNDYINNVKIVNRNNNRVKEIYFCHNTQPDTGIRIDNADLVKRNYQAASALIIGEIYFKFDISEVNVHLDIVNDSHIRVIPKRSRTDTFTFIYKFY